MVSTIDRVPIEVQQIVFTYLRNNSSDLSKCILVCKAWKSIFQNALYSKVRLFDYSQLAKFTKTLANSQYLSSLVRRLDFVFQIKLGIREKNANVAKLFTLLPNLEYLNCSLGNIYFTYILDALLDNHLPKLCYLKRPIAGMETRDYTTCALLLKNRLRNLSLNGAFAENEDIPYRRLIMGDSEDENLNDQEYDAFRPQRKHATQFHRIVDRLDQFKSLDELYITKSTNNTMKSIEEIIDTCPTLQTLSFHRSKLHKSNEDSSTTVTTNLTPAYDVTPAYNIKGLNISGSELDNAHLVEYIINKFPHLQKINIMGEAYSENPNRTFMDKDAMDKLFNYLTTIKDVQFDYMDCNEQTLIESIGSFWKTITKTRTLFVELMYKNSGKFYMNLKVNNGLTKSELFYPSRIDSVDTDIIETHGSYIDRLKIHQVEDPQGKRKRSSFEILFLHPHKHCINLKHLTIVNSTIRVTESLNDQIFERQTLDSLCLEYCSLIEEGAVLEQISKLYNHVKLLELIGLRGEEDEDGNTILRIYMGETNFDALTIFYEAEYYEEERRRILVKITTPKETTYYTHHFEATVRNLLLKPISERTFDKTSKRAESLSLDIECKSIKSLTLEHLEKVVNLTIK